MAKPAMFCWKSPSQAKPDESPTGAADGAFDHEKSSHDAASAMGASSFTPLLLQRFFDQNSDIHITVAKDGEVIF